MTYLSNPKAESLLRIQAYGYALSLLDPKLVKNDVAFTSWNDVVSGVNTQTHFTESAFSSSGSFFGTWVPRQSNAHLAIYAGVMTDQVKTGPVAVCAILHDEKDQRSDKYEQEWNGLLQFMNMMQFSKEFIAVSSSGVEQMAYLSLPVVVNEDITTHGGVHTSGTAWDQIVELLFDEDAKAFVAAAKEANLPAPEEDNIGFEVEGDDGEVMATVEIAWPDRKIGFLTAEQMEDKEKLEQLGWTIIDLFSLSDLTGLFGGEN
jgi:DEAD/DEAH box helicase domain-containing protein